MEAVRRHHPPAGSSPRVRGKREIGSADLALGRIIPARAGKTSARNCSQSSPRDHPRACGENGAQEPAAERTDGSSPRVRGKPRGAVRAPWGPRIIPARAGKTSLRRADSSSRADHPRACGENARMSWGPRPASGSSPRVRGKREHGHGLPPSPGIIPARAGKTCSGVPSRRARWDHPRACGENRVSVALPRSSSGSSPRVRGKHPGRPADRRLRRIIPARAGKT